MPTVREKFDAMNARMAKALDRSMRNAAADGECVSGVVVTYGTAEAWIEDDAGDLWYVNHETEFRAFPE